jgi:Cu/Ag efflux protein CusF
MNRNLAIIALALMLPLAACGREETTPGSSTVGAAEEQTYDLRGTVIGRDAATNQLTVDHEEIPGYMAAMTMPYEVRGQNVADLPADGTQITARVHATEEAYWLTDVQAAPGAATGTTTDTTMTDTTVTTGTTDTAGTTTGL